MKFLETIRETIERMLLKAQTLEKSNRRKSLLAYTPNMQTNYNREADQNASDAAELGRRLDRL